MDDRQRCHQPGQLQQVISLIASADYELGCAAAEAERAGAVTLSGTLSKLMLECVKLREDLRRQIGL
jgi:hypothetical protein